MHLEEDWRINMEAYYRQLKKELKEYLNVPQLPLMINGYMVLELVMEAGINVKVIEKRRIKLKQER